MATETATGTFKITTAAVAATLTNMITTAATITTMTIAVAVATPIISKVQGTTKALKRAITLVLAEAVT